MASSDTKSGFRLPWNSDRSPNEGTPEGAEATPEVVAEPAPASLEWPDTNIDARSGTSTNGQQRPTQEAAPDAAATDAAATETQVPEESQRMVEIEAPSAPAAAPRKPTKLMADLSAAIRATAAAARDQAVQQLDADARQVTEKIREGATEGSATLRKRSEDDVAGIRDWSKAEIARIREETDNRIATRKQVLEGELASHADAVNNRVEEVQSEVDRFKADMEEYFDRLGNEEDPSRLATMVEAMPDAPSFDAWADLAEVEDLVPDVEDAYVAADAVAELEPVEAIAETSDDDAPADEAIDSAAGDEVAQVVADEVVAETAIVEDAVTDVASDEAEQVVAEATAEPETSNDDAAKPAAKAVTWGEGDGDWRGSGDAAATPDDGSAVWAAGEVPEGFPTGAEGGEAVDRGAIMAALEAAAEAVVAAEAAADSADQAEAAADVAETAAELVVGRNAGEDGSLDPEAQAALDARVDAGGFEGSYADRLAHLLPTTPEAGADAEPKTTQVVVTGLVSVASIASFKRHLGRLSGVKTVAVASGPEGEFVFNVTHRPDVSFRDAIPSMQGFAARVTGQSEGVIQVTARDPESEN
ncbi:MAG TPA: hypothetical protein VIZ22_12815 [Candidatus Limnocylindrales bacterium]